MSEEVITSSEQKPAKSKRIVIAVLAVAIVAAVVAGVIFYKSYTAPTAQFQRAEAAGDNAGVDILLKKYGEELTDNVDVANTYNTKIEEVDRSFLAETIDYSAAIAELDRIQAKGITGTLENLTKVRGNIEALNNSRIAFKTAESFFGTENYPEAIGQYKKVIEADPNFATATARIEACYNNYRSKVLAEAEAMAAAGSYESAIGILESALTVLPNDATIQEQIILYKSKLSELAISDALANAATLAAGGDYAGAIRAIESQYRANPENYQLATRYSEYTADYEMQVLTTADTLAAERKYDEAIDQIKSALPLLSDSQPLKDKLAALEASKPIPVTSLNPVNGGFPWNEGTPEDPFGNTYSGSINFAILVSEDYWGYPMTFEAEYRVDSKYSLITGNMIPFTRIDEHATYQVKIYVDPGDENLQLFYTSPVIGRKTDPTPFEVNISGAKYVKIVVETQHKGSAILTDLQLWPK